MKVGNEVADDSGDFHHVESRLKASSRRIQMLLDHELDVVFAHLMHGPEDSETLRNRGRTFAVVHLDSADAAAVHELEAGNRLSRVDRIGEAFQTGDELVIPASGLADVALALAVRIHVNALHEAHAAYNAFCPAAHVGHIRIRHETVVSVEVVFRCRIDNPVRNHQVSDLNGFEQVGELLRPRVFRVIPFKQHSSHRASDLWLTSVLALSCSQLQPSISCGTAGTGYHTNSLQTTADELYP